MKKSWLAMALLVGLATGVGSASAENLSVGEFSRADGSLLLAYADGIQSVVDEDRSTVIDKKKKKKKSKKSKKSRRSSVGASDFGAGAGGNAGQWDLGETR
ncbi:MAG: hypothetical protein HQM00_13090 [Magnetococcales bacterium]|nr:hypothetical protein [Magnetococcales bacterium]